MARFGTVILEPAADLGANFMDQVTGVFIAWSFHEMEVYEKAGLVP